MAFRLLVLAAAMLPNAVSEMTLVSSALHCGGGGGGAAFPLLSDNTVETVVTTIAIPWLDLSLQENDPARLPDTAIWPQSETPFWIDSIKSTQPRLTPESPLNSWSCHKWQIATNASQWHSVRGALLLECFCVSCHSARRRVNRAPASYYQSYER